MLSIAYRSRDRTGWGAGPWDNEPDKLQFTDPATGAPCLAVRGSIGAWCGYVGVPHGSPLFGHDYNEIDDIIAVHGQLTFSDECAPDADEALYICHTVESGEDGRVWWFGFDCGHYGDYVPGMQGMGSFGANGIYRTLEYVQQQCAMLAAQLPLVKLEMLQIGD